jgi:hypothetical protein
MKAFGEAGSIRLAVGQDEWLESGIVDTRSRLSRRECSRDHELKLQVYSGLVSQYSGPHNGISNIG